MTKILGTLTFLRRKCLNEMCRYAGFNACKVQISESYASNRRGLRTIKTTAEIREVFLCFYLPKKLFSEKFTL